MKYQELREQICDVCHKMWQLGWVAANDGNVSVKLPDGNFIATPTGISKSFITPEKLVIINEKGEYFVIDWAHATQGNASADCARTYLLFSIQGKKELADKYLDLFSIRSGIEKNYIQRWIPIVAAEQMANGKEEEVEFLSQWIDVLDYE